MNLDQLKIQYIEGVYQTKALLIREQAFTLQSGKRSHIYLNHRNFLANNRYLSLVATIYHELAKTLVGEYILGAVDSVMSPVLVGAMSTMFQRDYVVVQKKPMTHGTQEFIYGTINKEVLLIDDMTSTGDTLIDAAQKIRAQGGCVKYAIISAHREETALKNLRNQQITALSIAGFEEIIDKLFPALTSTEQTIVQNNPLIMD